MALQLSETVRNARLDSLETAVGASAILKIRTGAPPAYRSPAHAASILRRSADSTTRSSRATKPRPRTASAAR